MIKTLQDARITDGLPRILQEQDWVSAMSEAVGTLHGQTMGFILQSQIYTALDKAPEEVLDALAAGWKIDWYDTGWSINQKRRTIHTALTVCRRMGTAESVRLQVESVYPGTVLEEWFQYGGKPGYYRLWLNIVDSSPEHPITMVTAQEMENRLVTAKRLSAHIESMSYMVRHEIQLGSKVEIWPITVQECGQARCGTLWKPAQKGYTVCAGICMGAQTGVNLASPPFAGTAPAGTKP